jgi:hypothetical protein
MCVEPWLVTVVEILFDDGDDNMMRMMIITTGRVR